MAFDHEQSPRMGQAIAPETPAVRMFAGEEIPVAAWPGQMIYRTDTQGLQVFNGDAWEDVVGGVAGLLTYVGPEEPVGAKVGDMWFDSSRDHALFRWDGSTWVLMQDAGAAFQEALDAAAAAAAAQAAADDAASDAAQAITDAASAEALADSKIRTFIQETEPMGLVAGDVGDLWLQTPDYVLYHWDGAQWLVSQDQALANDITAAAQAAQDAQDVADAAQAAADQAQPRVEDDGLITMYASNLAFLSKTNTSDTMIVVETGVPYPVTSNSQTMVSFSVRGYRYGHAETDMDIRVGAYAYITSNPIVNTGFVNKGSVPVSRVDLGYNAAEKLCAFIHTTAASGYLQIAVTDVTMRGGNRSAEGWVLATAPDLTNYTLTDDPHGLDIPKLDAAEKADFAQATADAAQAAADQAEADALAAMGVAEGKADIVFQSAAPTGDVNVYWVDTDTGRGHRWDGSQWVEIQDVDIQQALSDANDANTAAQSAQTAADNAQSTADTKVTTFYQDTAPTAEAVGDLWVNPSKGNLVSRWDGSSWVELTVGPDAVDPEVVSPTPDPLVSSPAVSVIGTAEGFILEAEDVDPGTKIQYHVSTEESFTPDATTTLGPPTAATVAYFGALPSGERFRQETTYYFKTVADNGTTPLPPASAEVGAVLDPAMVKSLAAAHLAAGFILAGEIQVGQITVHPDTGITVPQVDGDTIHIPADGSPARFTGSVITDDLTVETNAMLRGMSQIVGALNLAGTVPNPSSAPDVQTFRDGWTEYRDFKPGPNPDTLGYFRGIAFSTDNSIVFTAWDHLDDSISDQIEIIAAENSDPGVELLRKNVHVASLDNTYLFSMTKVGEELFVLWRNMTLSDERLEVAVFTADANLTLNRRMTIDDLPYPRDMTKGATIAGDEAGYIYIIYKATGGRLRAQKYTTAGVASGFTILGEPGILGEMLGGALYGSFDYGAPRFIVHVEAAPWRVYVFDDTGTRLSANEWQLRGEYAAWDGERFWERSSSTNTDLFDKIYSKAKNPDGHTITGRYTWADLNAEGGTHETAASPASPSVFVPPRSWWTITSQPAPEEGETDPDAARRIKVYIGTTDPAVCRYWRTHTEGFRTWVAEEESAPATGDIAPTTSDFVSIGESGLIQSGVSDVDGPIIVLRGDGSWRLGTLSGTGAEASVPTEALTPAPFSHRYRVSSFTQNGTTDDVIHFGTDNYTTGISYVADNGSLGYTHSQWTFEQAGLYRIDVNLSTDQSYTDGRYGAVQLYKNGSRIAVTRLGLVHWSTFTLGATLRMLPGDVLTAGFTAPNSTIAIRGGLDECFITIAWVATI